MFINRFIELLNFLRDKEMPELVCLRGDLHYIGLGTETNHLKAYKCYEVSANKGYDRGQSNLGWMYEYGEGCEKD